MNIILIIMIAVYVSIRYSKLFNEEEEEEMKDDKDFSHHVSATPFDKVIVHKDGSSETIYHNGDVKIIDKDGNAKIVDKDGNEKEIEYVEICIDGKKIKIATAKDLQDNSKITK